VASRPDRGGIYHGHLLGSRKRAASRSPDISYGQTGDALLACQGQLRGPDPICMTVTQDKLKTNPKENYACKWREDNV